MRGRLWSYRILLSSTNGRIHPSQIIGTATNSLIPTERRNSLAPQHTLRPIFAKKGAAPTMHSSYTEHLQPEERTQSTNHPPGSII